MIRYILIINLAFVGVVRGQSVNWMPGDVHVWDYYNAGVGSEWWGKSLYGPIHNATPYFNNLPNASSDVVNGVTYEFQFGDVIRSVSGTPKYSRLWIRGSTPEWYPLWGGDITRVTEGYRIRVELEEPRTYRVHWVPGPENSKKDSARFYVDHGTTDYVQHYLGEWPMVSVQELVSNKFRLIAVRSVEEDTLAFTTKGTYRPDYYIVQISRPNNSELLPAGSTEYVVEHGGDGLVWNCWDTVSGNQIFPSCTYYNGIAIFHFGKPIPADRYRLNYEVADSASIGNATSTEYRLHHMADSVMFDHVMVQEDNDGSAFTIGQAGVTNIAFEDYDYADFDFAKIPGVGNHRWYYTPRYVGYDQYNETFERLDGSNRTLMSGLHGNPTTDYTLRSATATVVAASENLLIPSKSTHTSDDIPSGYTEVFFDSDTNELKSWDGTTERTH